MKLPNLTKKHVIVTVLAGALVVVSYAKCPFVSKHVDSVVNQVKSLNLLK